MALVEYNEQKSSYYLNSAQYYDEPGILTVLAIPINEDECVFLPFPKAIGQMFNHADEEMKYDEEENTEGRTGERDEDDEFVFGDADSKFQKKKGIKGWWQRRRRQRWDRESKTDKFLKRIPSNVEHIRILYPTSLGERAAQEQLTQQITKTQSKRSARVLGLTAALPFALLLDLITFTFIFTITDVAMIVSNSKKLQRGKIVEELMASNHVSFAANDTLDGYYKAALQTTYKIPDNYLIDELCKNLNCEELAKTIRKVRNSKAARKNINLNTFEHRDSFTHVEPKKRDAYSTLDDDIPPEYDY